MDTLVEDREDTSYSKSTLACLDESSHYMVMDTVTRDPHVDPSVISRKLGEYHGDQRLISLRSLGVNKQQQPYANPSGV